MIKLMKNVKKGIQSDQTVTSTPIAQADKTEQEKGRLWSERSSGHDESVELQKKLKLAPMEGTQLEKKQIYNPTTRSLVQSVIDELEKSHSEKGKILVAVHQSQTPQDRREGARERSKDKRRNKKGRESRSESRKGK